MDTKELVKKMMDGKDYDLSNNIKAVKISGDQFINIEGVTVYDLGFIRDYPDVEFEFVGCSFRKSEVKDLDLSRCKFFHCVFMDYIFEDCVLGCVFYECVVINCSFEDSIFQGYMSGGVIDNSFFKGVLFLNNNFIGTSVLDVDLFSCSYYKNFILDSYGQEDLYKFYNLHDSEEIVDVYGIEGSRPESAAIGLGPAGYVGAITTYNDGSVSIPVWWDGEKFLTDVEGFNRFPVSLNFWGYRSEFDFE